MNSPLSWWCKFFLCPAIKALFIKQVKGIENIPQGNFILAGNHLSYLDQIILGYICVPRRFRFIGQTDRFKGLSKLLLYIVYSAAGVIFLNRKDPESKKQVLEKSIQFLKKGDIIIIYPEGTRSRTGKIGKGKWGVAKLYLKSGVPILPAGIKGTFEIFPPRGKIKIKRIVEVNIGKTLAFPQEMSKTNGLDEESKEYQEILQNITDKTMEEIAKLIA